jgi:hypothetical protein
MPEYTDILTETHGRVGLVRLNRPKAMNALRGQLLAELLDALRAFDADDAIGAMVITGSERAFSAGADIKEMADATAVDLMNRGLSDGWHRISTIRKPMIAAVSGFALGGGCELALLCDLIVASETAQFGQPEITIGVIPGAGGTQDAGSRMGSIPFVDLLWRNKACDILRQFARLLIVWKCPINFIRLCKQKCFKFMQSQKWQEARVIYFPRQCILQMTCPLIARTFWSVVHSGEGLGQVVIVDQRSHSADTCIAQQPLNILACLCVGSDAPFESRARTGSFGAGQNGGHTHFKSEKVGEQERTDKCLFGLAFHINEQPLHSEGLPPRMFFSHKSPRPYSSSQLSTACSGSRLNTD